MHVIFPINPVPQLPFLAEFDAYQVFIMHAGIICLVLTWALAASIVKQFIDETGGEIRVYGTPGRRGRERIS